MSKGLEIHNFIRCSSTMTEHLSLEFRGNLNRTLALAFQRNMVSSGADSNRDRICQSLPLINRFALGEMPPRWD